MTPLRVVVAVPCHRDEPGVGVTVASLAKSAALVRDATVQIVVCINGHEPGRGPAADGLTRSSARFSVHLLDIASKPAAWNVLRSEPGDIHVFADADVVVSDGAIPALVDALRVPGVVASAGIQSHRGQGAVARVARVPHRLAWGGLLGTLYAVRSDSLPAAMPTVILDDAWLFGALGAQGRVVQVSEAVAHVQLPTRWRDLWRQRVRAERGKQQLRAMGVPLAEAPPGASIMTVWRAYPATEWPYVAALALVKLAAATRARFGEPTWDLADSTKR